MVADDHRKVYTLVEETALRPLDPIKIVYQRVSEGIETDVFFSLRSGFCGYPGTSTC